MCLLEILIPFSHVHKLTSLYTVCICLSSNAKRNLLSEKDFMCERASPTVQMMFVSHVMPTPISWTPPTPVIPYPV